MENSTKVEDKSFAIHINIQRSTSENKVQQALHFGGFKVGSKIKYISSPLAGNQALTIDDDFLLAASCNFYMAKSLPTVFYCCLHSVEHHFNTK